MGLLSANSFNVIKLKHAIWILGGLYRLKKLRQKAMLKHCLKNVKKIIKI